MAGLLALLCRFKDRPRTLVALAVLLLLLLYLLREWLWALFVLYLAALVLLGLLGGLRLAQAILRKLCWKQSADPKGTGSEGHPSSKPVYLPPHTYKRPDPMIYSQHYLMSKGIAITWDNPDIHLVDAAGVAVPSHSLLPGAAYTIRARIWNGSTDAPAINVRVVFHYLTFGIGAARQYIGETYVDVAVKGSPVGPAIAEMPWTTPPAGHYCIQVELHWLDDANPLNNLGQENVDVKKLNSPNATFTFAVRNTSPRPRALRLRADSYTIPAKAPCPDLRRPKSGFQARDPYASHRPAAHPVPEGWVIAIQGLDEGQVLTPGEERAVSVTITSTDAPVAMQAININGFTGDELVGGVTLYVHS